RLDARIGESGFAPFDGYGIIILRRVVVVREMAVFAELVRDIKTDHDLFELSDLFRTEVFRPEMVGFFRVEKRGRRHHADMIRVPIDPKRIILLDRLPLFDARIDSIEGERLVFLLPNDLKAGSFEGARSD